MFYLLRYNKSPVYNVYCDVANDTSGVRYTISECLVQLKYLSPSDSIYKNVADFRKSHPSKLIAKFNSPKELHTTYPELFI